MLPSNRPTSTAAGSQTVSMDPVQAAAPIAPPYSPLTYDHRACTRATSSGVTPAPSSRLPFVSALHCLAAGLTAAMMCVAWMVAPLARSSGMSACLPAAVHSHLLRTQ